jgi:hypothetical protein
MGASTWPESLPQAAFCGEKGFFLLEKLVKSTPFGP